jgi:hypothetical protein
VPPSFATHLCMLPTAVERPVEQVAPLVTLEVNSERRRVALCRSTFVAHERCQLLPCYVECSVLATSPISSPKIVLSEVVLLPMSHPIYVAERPYAQSVCLINRNSEADQREEVDLQNLNRAGRQASFGVRTFWGSLKTHGYLKTGHKFAGCHAS